MQKIAGAGSVLPGPDPSRRSGPGHDRDKPEDRGMTVRSGDKSQSKFSDYFFANFVLRGLCDISVISFRKMASANWL